MTESQRILFVHIPKSAGISLYRAFAKIFGEDKSIRFADGSEENKNKYLTMTKEEVRNYRLISGHFPLPFFLNKPINDYKIITVVRNPIDRELSAYYYMKTWAQHPRHNVVQKMNLYEYADSRENQSRRNLQCWHIANKGSFEEAKKILEEKVFLSAPLEYIKPFCKTLQSRLNLPEINLAYENVTSFRFSANELHPEIIKRFEKLTEEDFLLYKYVKEKFEQEVLNAPIRKTNVVSGLDILE